MFAEIEMPPLRVLPILKVPAVMKSSSVGVIPNLFAVFVPTSIARPLVWGLISTAPEDALMEAAIAKSSEANVTALAVIEEF